MISIRKLLAAGCAAAPLLAPAAGLPAGTTYGAGLTWQVPGATNFNPAGAAGYCAASTVGGASGWRLPTALEITNLYYEQGAKLVAGGWPDDWIQTSDPFLGHTKIVRVTDGTLSYGSGLQPVTCVHSGFAPVPPVVSPGRSTLAWQQPGAQAMNWSDAAAYCTASGKRLPTTVELTNLYYENGAAHLADKGWPSDWIWTSTVYSSGHQVVRLTDGLPSWNISGSYPVTCVSDPQALPANTLSSNGLLFLSPAAGTRDWNAAEAACSASAAGGLTGWRQPNALELADFYYQHGAAVLQQAGWPTNWIWTATPYSGYKVLRITDGAWSYSGAGGAYASTCVHGAPAQTPPVPAVDATLISGALAWSLPSGLPRPYTNTAGYCTAASIAGQQGWRLPTEAELIALHAAEGSAALAASGWPTGWIWTSSPYSSGFKVVRLSDGTWSWAGWGDDARYDVSCVKDSAQFSSAPGSSANTITIGSLTYQKPATLARPWANTVGYCTPQYQGQSGWRLPSRAELEALYADKGAAALAQAGWPASWMWTGDQWGTSGYQMVRMSDGTFSWSNLQESDRFSASCVRDPEALPTGSLSSGGLTWLRPPVLPRPWSNTVGYCTAQDAGGHSDWRLPTSEELLALHGSVGWSGLASAGWPSDYLWSSSTYSSGWKIVKLSTGGWSWSVDDNSSRYYPVCVR